MLYHICTCIAKSSVLACPCMHEWLIYYWYKLLASFLVCRYMCIVCMSRNNLVKCKIFNLTFFFDSERERSGTCMNPLSTFYQMRKLKLLMQENEVLGKNPSTKHICTVDFFFFNMNLLSSTVALLSSSIQKKNTNCNFISLSDKTLA